jgi:hypothetical protein
MDDAPLIDDVILRMHREWCADGVTMKLADVRDVSLGNNVEVDLYVLARMLLELAAARGIDDANRQMPLIMDMVEGKDATRSNSLPEVAVGS